MSFSPLRLYSTEKCTDMQPWQWDDYQGAFSHSTNCHVYPGNTLKTTHLQKHA